MKKFLVLTMVILAAAFIGCSDDDDDITGGGVENTATSTWDATGEFWSTNVNGTSSDNFMYFSFLNNDTVTSGTPKISGIDASVWDIAFRREEIKTNGGVSTNNSGDMSVATLGEIDFAGITMADTLNADWNSDHIDYFIDDWYDYNPMTHALTANRNVYSMVDAGGNNFLKFQIDSMVGAGAPPDMGTIYMEYFYQTTADSPDLSGAGVDVVIPVGAVKTYFDFSSGSVVTPATPESSTAWDIAFYAYDLSTNSGPNGIGNCLAFTAFSELIDPTDFAGFMQQPNGAPMFPDIAGSALTEWYTYTGPPMHQLFSNSEVYLLKTGDTVYKMRIESYYGEMGDQTSANYNFIWVEL